MSVDTAPTALSAARAAQRAARDHGFYCRDRFEWCLWCQWHERNTSALYARADAELEASRA